MKVLVTGAAGFLGRHFVAALRDAHDVLPVDLDVYNDDAIDFFYHDHTAWDLVLHCAAVAPHRTAIDGSPLAVGAGGLALDSMMFRWAEHTKPGRVVYFSSSAVYPVTYQDGRSTERLKESDVWLDFPAFPDAIYGTVKVMGERLAELYRAQGGAVTVVRPFSGYGEDQSPEFPFGAFRDRARRREDPFTIWGDGTQVRDWVHVDDVVGAVLAAADQDVDGPVNICTGVGTSMTELATMFCREAGYTPEFDYRTDAPAGVAHRVGDPARMREFYEPKVTIQEGVRRAITR